MNKTLSRIQNQDLKTFITYNNETKIIQIEANLSNLHFIKNYVNSELGIKADSEKIKIKKLASFDTCEYEDNQINTYKALRTLLS
ncbi:hypothetical protein HHI36_020492 [Cryptolaemus montrouzieri]|uniref:Uncharacterized protein n=1 Tax=Cryptolaemus montrouzieri TaxID=559131 RepID=A0ABD2NAN9_9CUCU